MPTNPYLERTSPYGGYKQNPQPDPYFDQLFPWLKNKLSGLFPEPTRDEPAFQPRETPYSPPQPEPAIPTGGLERTSPYGGYKVNPEPNPWGELFGSDEPEPVSTPTPSPSFNPNPSPSPTGLSTAGTRAIGGLSGLGATALPPTGSGVLRNPPDPNGDMLRKLGIDLPTDFRAYRNTTSNEDQTSQIPDVGTSSKPGPTSNTSGSTSAVSQTDGDMLAGDDTFAPSNTNAIESQRDMYGQIREKLLESIGSETPEEEAYRAHMAGQPEWKAPGTGRKIAAMLLSALEGARSGTGAGVNLGQHILDFPYQEQQRIWKQQGEKLGESARLSQRKADRERSALQFSLSETGRDTDRLERDQDRDESRWWRRKEFSTRTKEREEDRKYRTEQDKKEDKRWWARENRYKASEKEANPYKRLADEKVRNEYRQRAVLDIASNPKYSELFDRDEKGNVLGWKEKMPGQGWFSRDRALTAEERNLMAEANAAIESLASDMYSGKTKTRMRGFTIPNVPTLSSDEETQDYEEF